MMLPQAALHSKIKINVYIFQLFVFKLNKKYLQHKHKIKYILLLKLCEQYTCQEGIGLELLVFICEARMHIERFS